MNFTTVIETVPAEQWQKRTLALQQLVSGIPDEIPDADTIWYNSPKYLRHLAIPLSQLLKDARSSVVKRTCDSCTLLFAKCGKNARYLLKDIMPTILSVHAQTVQVIRNAVQEMMTASLPMVPCKMVIPMWLERLKSDKSRTVRDACAHYLSVALASWTEEGYMSQEIWFQVGTSLIRALRDPSPSVRTQAKVGLEEVRQSQPAVWHRLIHDPDGPAAKDPKLKRVLLRVGNEESMEDLSVASRGSSVSSRQQMFPPRSQAYRRPARPIPTAVLVADDTNQHQLKRSGLGPPLRVSNGTAPLSSPHRQARSTVNSRNSPRYKVGAPPRLHSPEIDRISVEASQAKGKNLDETFKDHPSNLNVSTPETTTTIESAAEEEAPLDDEGPFIASVRELKRQAMGRRSRRSSFLQERFRQSSSNLVEAPEESAPVDDTLVHTEHKQIAEQLLEAHRIHVDKIMETLRMEMDALKEFEQLVLDETRPTRPTEDEVLDYFESVGLCLDQRTTSGKELQKEMDRISKGVS